MRALLLIGPLALLMSRSRSCDWEPSCVVYLSVFLCVKPPCSLSGCLVPRDQKKASGEHH